MDHFYFVHSSVDGHFLCFQVLAMVNILGVQDCQPVTFFFFCRKVKYVYEHLFDTADEVESGVQGIEDAKNCTVLNCANSRCITFLVLVLF